MGYPVKFSGLLWDYCEGCVLDYMAFLGFRASLELREDGFGSRLQVTNGDPAGFSCDQHRTCVLCTLSLRQANHWHDRQTERFSPCSLSLLFFPTQGKHQTGHAHTDTQHSSCDHQHTPPSTSGTRLPYAPVLPALHANFEGLFKASCFPDSVT